MCCRFPSTGPFYSCRLRLHAHVGLCESHNMRCKCRRSQLQRWRKKIAPCPLPALSTSATDTTPMVIAIIGVTSSSITISAPTVAGSAMSSLCATSGLAPAVAAFYYQSTSALSGAQISWSATGAASSDYATLVAFAMQGQITTGTVTDGSCFASSAVTTSTTPSVTVTGLAESNDFIFGSAISVAPPLSTTTGA